MNNAGDKLKEFGQEHVLAFYEELSKEEQNGLNTQIEAVDFSVIKNSLANMTVDERGEISPISVMSIDEIEAKKTVYLEKGHKAIENDGYRDANCADGCRCGKQATDCVLAHKGECENGNSP